MTAKMIWHLLWPRRKRDFITQDAPQPSPMPVPVVMTGGWLGIPLPLWQMAIAALVTIILGWMQRSTQNQISDVENIAHSTHTLVNSNQGTQLKLHAATAKRLAIMSGNPQDEQIAKQAEAAVHDHEAAQGKVDAKNPK